MQKLISLLMAVMVVLTFIGAGYAQSITGQSNMVLSETSATLPPGTRTTANFTMQLVNGTAGQTFIIIANSTQLTQAGINVFMVNASGTPTFSGQINIQALDNVTPGFYNISITTGGADPAGTVYFALTVPGATTTIPSTNSTSSASTTINNTNYTNSTVPTTTVGGTTTGGLSTGVLALVAIIVIVVIVIIALVVLKGRRTV